MRKKIAFIFIIASLLILAKPSYHFLKRAYLHHYAQQQWQAWKAVKRPSQTGEPIAWLKSDEVALNELVLRGTDPKILLQTPGLSETWSLPDNPGLKVILGHRDLHFKNLNALKIGSRLELESVNQSQTYQVVDIEILTPEKTEQKLKEYQKESRLALVTCYPFQYIGAAPQRYLIWAAPL